MDLEARDVVVDPREGRISVPRSPRSAHRTIALANVSAIEAVERARRDGAYHAVVLRVDHGSGAPEEIELLVARDAPGAAAVANLLTKSVQRSREAVLR